VFAKSRRENGKVAYAHVQDIRPFVNKPPPLVQRPSTVGGLDKRAADNYWRAYKPRKGDGRSFFTGCRTCVYAKSAARVHKARVNTPYRDQF
jgi:hypothetical protein